MLVKRWKWFIEQKCDFEATAAGEPTRPNEIQPEEIAHSSQIKLYLHILLTFKWRFRQLLHRKKLSRKQKKTNPTREAGDGHSHTDLSSPWGVWVLLMGAQLFARCITHWQQCLHWMFIKQVIRDKTRSFQELLRDWALAPRKIKSF